MSFCGKCGAENASNAKFCQKCGAPLQAQMVYGNVKKAEAPKNVSTSNNANAPVPRPAVAKKSSSNTTKIIGWICIGLVAAIGIILFVATRKPTINLDKYTTVEVEGYNGYGRAQISVDWDAIEEKYGDRIEYLSAAKKEYGEFLKLMTPVEVLREEVGVELDNTTKLSNGDVLEYTWDVDDEISEYVKCNVKFKNGTYTVSGLTELDKFDAFSDVTVTFSGIAPDGDLDIEYTGEEFNSYDFSVSSYNNLSNGDVVTVTLDESRVERCAEEYGKVPETLEKQYTVEGLSSYVTSLSEVSDQALNDMKKQAEDVFHAHAAKSYGDGEELKSLTYLGNYLLTNKGNAYGRNNYLFLVYRAQVHNTASSKNQSYNKVNDVYWYAAFNNLMVDDNGVVTVDVTDYDTPNDRFTIDSRVSSGWFGTHSWYYYGYEDLDSLYKKVVTSNLDGYNHEDDVNEALAPQEAVKEPEMSSDADYILPDSDKKLISEADLKGFDAEKCKIARNEIYARHGRRFKDEALQEYFDSKDWYEGIIDPDDFQESILSDIEIKNKDVIVEYEKDKGFR